MRVRVLAFARIREILGAAHRDVTLPDGSVAGDAWDALAGEVPGLVPLRASTRLARNGRLAAGDEPLHDGDELALLPPSGGG